MGRVYQTRLAGTVEARNRGLSATQLPRDICVAISRDMALVPGKSGTRTATGIRGPGGLLRNAPQPLPTAPSLAA